MVTASPEQIRDGAVRFFKRSEMSDAFGWVSLLSPVHQRLFAVELADALKQATITEDLGKLIELFEDWEATAELDADPEVLEEVRRPKRRRPLSDFVTA